MVDLAFVVFGEDADTGGFFDGESGIFPKVVICLFVCEFFVGEGNIEIAIEVVVG